MWPILASLLFLTAGVEARGQDGDAAPPPDRSRINQSIDQRGANRCVGNLIGISGVQMRCTVAQDATARNCEILNPSPAVLRHQGVFHCIAARATFTYADGSPAVGEEVFLNLGARLDLNGPDRD